jgi:hypothetical protein
MVKRAVTRRSAEAKAARVVFSVRLPARTIRALRALAARNRRTVATQTLIVIEHGLKAAAAKEAT